MATWSKASAIPTALLIVVIAVSVPPVRVALTAPLVVSDASATGDAA